MVAEPNPLAGWPPPVLDPAGPFAAPVNLVSWALFGMALVVIAVTFGALALALFGPPRWKARMGELKLVLLGGLAFPTVVLSALLVWGLMLTNDLSEAPRPGEMRVRITGEMWWWRVAYLDGAGREVLQDANEVHIPAGRPIVFELEAADVIHSFWVPQLGGKEDMIPGRRNILRLQADRPGVYGGQCAEYCGGPHALMGLVVVAHERAAFEAWKTRSIAPAAAPADPLAQRGAQVFDQAGCGVCHTVRGTTANGMAGPDLSRVGARRTLGAGILPNNQGTLTGWIADSQAIKPGNRMPAYSTLSGADLRAAAAYLGALR